MRNLSSLVPIVAGVRFLTAICLALPMLPDAHAKSGAAIKLESKVGTYPSEATAARSVTVDSVKVVR